MASILKLPDEVLIRICKMLDRDEQEYRWANVCKRFQYIYFRYFQNWTELNDSLAQNFGHLIGTGEFPLRIIKTLNLSKSKCTKVFLNKLRDCHKEIEEAELFSFTDEFLAELLPLPNLKKLICIGTYNLRGSRLIDLNSLTELHIHTDESFDPEYLLQIATHNPLKTFVMRNDPQTYSDRHAFDLFENLKNVEERMTEFNPCKSWELICTLPKLKKLTLSNFVSHECELCLKDPNSYEARGKGLNMPSFDELRTRNQLEACGSQHAMLFFDELCKRNQLEELVFCDGNVSEQHLLRISELTNLQRLKFYRTSMPEILSLDVFKDLVNLEELQLGDCLQVNVEGSLELIRRCQKLKILNFANGLTVNFLTEANYILSQRQPPSTEPLTLVFDWPEYWQKITFKKMLPFLKCMEVTRKFVWADEDYLKREEHIKSKMDVHNDWMKRRLSAKYWSVLEETKLRYPMDYILKLPDEVLIRICKMLDRDEQQYSWANVCKRFQYIYFRYFHNWTELNDNLAQNFGHLIGTGEFPLRIIKTLNLSKSKCTKVFLNKLRNCHKEIEEAKLFSFTDEFLAELLPLPNLKKLICIGTYNLTGSRLIDLNSLTELHILTNKSFHPENLLQIAYHNPLKTFVMPNDPQTFSDRYAFDLVENLKNVEKLVTQFNPCKSSQLIGTLPKLKKLELWNFHSRKCELCLEDSNSYEACGNLHAMLFFDELCKRNQLEELVFWYGNVYELHLLRISELTNLQRLKFCRTSMPDFLSLDVFKDLVNLEELQLGDCFEVNAEGSLELIRRCQKLKKLNVSMAKGITVNFFTEANDILSQRQPPSTEPLTLAFGFLEKYLTLEKPLPFLKFVEVKQKFVEAEEDYLKREEDIVSQTDDEGYSLKRKFRVMNMVSDETEFEFKVKCTSN